MGASGEIYAVAQGSVAIAGFQAEGAAATLTRGVPTVGRIANGALIEQEIEFQFKDTRSVKLALRNPDLTTGKRIASAINEYMAANSAEPTDPSTVNLTIPKNFKGNMVQLLTEIEQLRIDPDQVARVVVEERSGVIVMGKDVRVSTVAIAQGNLTISVTEQPIVSQPDAFSNGQTVVVPRTTIQVDQGANNKLAVLKESVTLKELVDGLNALGIGPRDIISILQAIKTSGALQADIVVM